MTSNEESQNEQKQLISPSEESNNHGEFSKMRHWKNLIVLSLTLLFCFTAFGCIQNVQSSINASHGLGLLSLSLVYGSIIISTLLTPTVITFFKTKWSITISTVSFCIYTFSNFYPSYASLILSSCFAGFCSSTLWVASTTYLTTSAFQFAEISGEKIEYVISRFNGIMYALFQTNQIWGNLISFTVLKTKNSETNKPINVSDCGLNSCGASITSGTDLPDNNEVNLLLGLLSLCGIISVLLPLCFLDELPPTTSINVKSWKTQLVSTFKLMTSNIKLILLIPIMMYSGIELAFLAGDFTKAFITCTQDVSAVGLIMIGFGVSGVVSGLIIGQLVKITGRIFLFSLGAAVHLSLLVYLYLWDPETGQIWQLVLVSVGWGIGDATWMVQLFSLIGVVFPTNREPAFSCCTLWQAVGFCVTFVTSIPESICMFHKIIGIGIWLMFSMIMYYICELKIRRPANVFVVIQNT